MASVPSLLGTGVESWTPFCYGSTIMPLPLPTIFACLAATWAFATATAYVVEKCGFPLPATSRRSSCLDGLRGYLALSVMVHHFAIWFAVVRSGSEWRAPDLPVLNELGAGAVSQFFMITGFVFYKRVLAGFRNTNWTAVYITRVFRIMPLLVVSVALVCMVASSRTGQWFRPDDLPKLFRWVTTWAEPPLLGDPDAGRINAYVLWSLRLEWMFYVVVLPSSALAMDLVRTRLPSVVVPIILLAITEISHLLRIKIDLIEFLPFFAAGMISQELCKIPAIVGIMKLRATAIIVGAILLATALVFQTPLSWAYPSFGLFFVCVSCGNSFFGLFRSKASFVLGEISFSIYLLHGIALSLLFVEGQHIVLSVPIAYVPLLLPLVAVAITLLSCGTYLAVERPAMRLGVRLAEKYANLRLRGQSNQIDVAP